MTATTTVSHRVQGGFLMSVAVMLAAASAAWFTVRERPAASHAVAFATAICLLGTTASWVVMRQPATSPGAMMARPLLAVALRFFPALGALAWLQTGGVHLLAAGAGEWLVFFYLVMLASEIVRSMMMGRQSTRLPAGTKSI